MTNEIIRHFGELYRGCDSGYLCTSILRADGTVKKSHWFSINELKQAAEMTEKLSKTENIYYGLCLYSDTSGGRGSALTAEWLPGLYADLDFGALGSDSAYVGEKNPPASLEDIKAFLAEAGYPAPSIMESTGNGMHAYWLLDRPFKIETEQHRERASSLYRSFITHLREEASLRGWKLDVVGQLARIGRAPGTLNHGKASRPHGPKPVSVIEGDYSIRHTMESLEAVSAHMPSRPPVAPALDACFLSDTQPTFDKIKAGCGFIQHAIEDAATLSEGEWHAALGVVAHVEDGDAIGHEISKPYPGYQRKQTDEYIRRAKLFGPRTCADISGRFGHSSCKKCLFRQSPSARAGRFNSPIALGYGKDDVAVVSLASEYAYDADQNAAYHRDVMDPVVDASFKRLEARRVSDAPRALTSYRHAAVAHKSNFLPGQPRLVEEDGRLVLNTYKPPTMVPEAGDWSTIRGHFELLCGDPVITDHVLGYLAHLVQHPAEKLGHCILFIGGQGVGKTTALSWMRYVLGPSNFKVLTNKAAKSDWTADLMEAVLVVVEELMGDDRLSTYNDLKIYITDDTAPANQKFARLKRLKTARGYVAMSNHLDPIMPERDDRRFYVVKIKAEKQSQAYYDALYAKAPGEIPAFFAHLASRELTGFSSHDAPMTAAKADMIDMTAPPIDSAIRQGLEDGTGPFQSDVGTLGDIHRWLAFTDPRLRNATDAEITKCLRRLGATKIDKQVRVGNLPVRLWVFRNAEQWQASSPTALRAAYKPYMEPLISQLEKVGISPALKAA